VFLHGVHIRTYTQGTWTNHEPAGPQAPAQRHEIDRIAIGSRSGVCIVPLTLSFKDGRV
jgi:tmRNA-binding protein